MASSRAHLAATLALAAATGAVTVATLSPLWFGVTRGILAGTIITPDLDTDRGSVTVRRVRAIFRRLAGKRPANVIARIWWAIWRPYARIVPHRSPLSHFPILGTVGRLAYLAGWLAVPVALALIFAPAVLFWLAMFVLSNMVGDFLGLCASDALHWVMDGFPMRSVR